jgi:hypothetical protein
LQREDKLWRGQPHDVEILRRRLRDVGCEAGAEKRTLGRGVDEAERIGRASTFLCGNV